MLAMRSLDSELRAHGLTPTIAVLRAASELLAKGATQAEAAQVVCHDMRRDAGHECAKHPEAAKARRERKAAGLPISGC